MTRRQCTSTLSSQIWISIPSVGKHFLVCLLFPLSQIQKSFCVEKPGSPQRIIRNCAGGSFNAASLINLNISSESENQLIEDIQNGSSVLHLACLASDAGMVDLLLQYGADINACDSRGRTPLHYCITRGKPAAAKVLLVRYVDIFNHCDQIINEPFALQTRENVYF